MSRYQSLALFIAAAWRSLHYVAPKAPELSESKLVATTSSKIYDNDELIADLGSEQSGQCPSKRNTDRFGQRYCFD